MTAQCKHCKELVIPQRITAPDPLGMLAVRALAEQVRNHYMVQHPKELSSVASVLLLLQSRIMLTLVDCADPTYKDKARQLTSVLVTLFMEADEDLESVVVPAAPKLILVKE